MHAPHRQGRGFERPDASGTSSDPAAVALLRGASAAGGRGCRAHLCLLTDLTSSWIPAEARCRGGGGARGGRGSGRGQALVRLGGGRGVAAFRPDARAAAPPGLTGAVPGRPAALGGHGWRLLSQAAGGTVGSCEARRSGDAWIPGGVAQSALPGCAALQLRVSGGWSERWQTEQPGPCCVGPSPVARVLVECPALAAPRVRHDAAWSLRAVSQPSRDPESRASWHSNVTIQDTRTGHTRGMELGRPPPAQTRSALLAHTSGSAELGPASRALRARLRARTRPSRPRRAHRARSVPEAEPASCPPGSGPAALLTSENGGPGAGWRPS